MGRNEKLVTTQRATFANMNNFILNKFTKDNQASYENNEDRLFVNYLTSLLGTVFSTPEEEIIK